MENNEGPTPVRRTARARKVNSRFVDDADESYKKLVDRITASDQSRQHNAAIGKENKSVKHSDKISSINGTSPVIVSLANETGSPAVNGTLSQPQDVISENSQAIGLARSPHVKLPQKSDSQSTLSVHTDLDKELIEAVSSFSVQKQPRIILSRSDAVSPKNGDPSDKTSSIVHGMVCSSKSSPTATESSALVFSSDGEDDIPLNQLASKSEVKGRSATGKAKKSKKIPVKSTPGGSNVRSNPITINVKKIRKKTKVSKVDFPSKSKKLQTPTGENSNLPAKKRKGISENTEKSSKRPKVQENSEESRTFSGSRLVTHSDLVLEVPVANEQTQSTPTKVTTPVKIEPMKKKEKSSVMDFETALNPKVDCVKKETKLRKSGEFSHPSKTGKKDAPSNQNTGQNSLSKKDVLGVISKESPKIVKPVSEKRLHGSDGGHVPTQNLTPKKESKSSIKKENANTPTDSFEKGLYVIESKAGMFVLDTSSSDQSKKEKNNPVKLEASTSDARIDKDSHKTSIMSPEKLMEALHKKSDKQESRSFIESTKQEMSNSLSGSQESSTASEKRSSSLEKSPSAQEKPTIELEKSSFKSEKSPQREVKHEEERHRSRHHKSKSSRRDSRDESREKHKHSKDRRSSDTKHRRESSSSRHKSSHRHRSSSDRKSLETSRSLKVEVKPETSPNTKNESSTPVPASLQRFIKIEAKSQPNRVIDKHTSDSSILKERNSGNVPGQAQMKSEDSVVNEEDTKSVQIGCGKETKKTDDNCKEIVKKEIVMETTLKQSPNESSDIKSIQSTVSSKDASRESLNQDKPTEMPLSEALVSVEKSETKEEIYHTLKTSIIPANQEVLPEHKEDHEKANCEEETPNSTEAIKIETSCIPPVESKVVPSEPILSAVHSNSVEHLTQDTAPIKREENLQEVKVEQKPVIEVYSTTSEPENICHAKIKVESEQTDKAEVTILSESKISLKMEPDYKAKIEQALQSFREKCKPQLTDLESTAETSNTSISESVSSHPMKPDQDATKIDRHEDNITTDVNATNSEVGQNELPFNSSSVDSKLSVVEPMAVDDIPTETPEETERKNKEVVAQRMKSFELLTENHYLMERKKNHSKEVRRMVCDCFLSKEEIANNEMGCGDDCLNRLLMIECGSRCPLGQLCLNRQFQNRTYADIEVFNAANKGCGVRAMKDIRAGSFIMEYIGEVFDYKEFRRRRKEYAKDSTSHFYFMALRADSLIDATRKGNISRFVNHSCEPNAETQKWTVNGDIRIGFFSTRHIAAGEEINFDYRLERYGREPQKCYCGTPTCRGWLGEAPDEKTKEEKEEDRKRELKDKRKRDEKRAYFDDLNLANEIEKLSFHGLRNRQDTLNLSRLMVRAEDTSLRLSLLQLLVNGHQSCKRLFLDYHGLKVLWSWMADIGTGPDNLHLKLEILKVLGALPITNRTQLTDSRVFYVVERWTEQDASTDTVSSPDIQETSETISKPSTSETSPTDLDSSSPGDSGDSSEADKMASKETTQKEGDNKTSEISEAKAIEDKNSILNLASTLLAKWKLLSEAFRIPKKERLEIMREHEREVEMGFREYISKQTSLLSNYGSYYDRRSPDKDEWKKRAKRTRRDSWPKMPEFNEEDKHLSKEERREKFAQRVAQQEEEARQVRDMQRAMWNYHLQRCSHLGQDPSLTPLFDPSGEFYWDPIPAIWQPFIGMFTTLPVPANYQCSPEEDCSPRVPSTPLANNLPFPAGSLPTMFPPTNALALIPLPESCLPVEDINGPRPQSPELRPPVPIMITVPDKWRMARTPEGHVYFYHTKTRVSQWEQPSPDLHQKLLDRYGMEDDSDTESSDISSSDSEEFSSEEEEEEQVSVVCSADGGGEKMVRRNRGTGRRSEKLVQERVISPIMFEDREQARLERRLAKDRARMEAREERQPRSGQPRDDEDSGNEEDEPPPVFVKPKKSKSVHYKTKSKTRALNALADNSEKAKKVKEQFRMNMATYIVSVLNPYRRSDCKQGRITSTEDFKFLARKLTHFVMVKELKQLPNTKKLDCNDSVKTKTKDFVRKYMSKFKEDFKRDPLDTKEY